MSLSTPVAFLIFNRLDVTEKVFSAIALAKPKKLFVVADGPRFPEEVEKCEKTRSIIQRVNWDCEVLTNFSDTNLGCGQRISSGIDWVFSQVEEAIFLEDDTLPTHSFFSFCEAMLERYRYDERVMHINGDNSVNQNRVADSYYFSRYVHIWGWASWRRAWQHYDYQMKTWPMFKQSGCFKTVCEDPYERAYWENIFDQMNNDPQVIDTWDYQWLYACWSQGGLAIAPNQNLISNIGFNRLDAAHTIGGSSRACLPTADIWEIQHPLFVVKQQEADRRSFDLIFGGEAMRKQNKIFTKVRSRLSSMRNKLTLQF
jgi:hypothetical protein